MVVSAPTTAVSEPSGQMSGMRPKDALWPTRPQKPAGMRVDPPPSLAPAHGTIPAATAAAVPPDDPPGVWSVFHGLRAAPRCHDSVMPLAPNSGVFVCPNTRRPESSQRCTVVVVSTAR